MRSVAVAALLFLAGCVQTASDQDGLDEGSTFVGVANPTIDTFMDDYQSFIETYGDRHGNSASHLGAREALKQRMAEAGLEVWVQGFQGDYAQENIVAIDWGQNRQDWIVVGAHYDTITQDCAPGSLTGTNAPCPGAAVSQGAYDNGSGTSIVADLAQRFSPATSNATLVFVFFDGEEIGFQGSRAFVESVLTGASPYGEVNIRLAIIIDVFGLTWPGIDSPMRVWGTAGSVKTAFDEARLAIGVPDDMVEFREDILAGGDDVTFQDADIPYVAMDSDFHKHGDPTHTGLPTAPAQDFTTLNPFYHSVDTWDTMSAYVGGEQNIAPGFETSLRILTSILAQY